MRQDAINDPFADLVRPFAWICAAAFLAGFVLMIAMAAPRLGVGVLASPEGASAAAHHAAWRAEGRREI